MTTLGGPATRLERRLAAAQAAPLLGLLLLVLACWAWILPASLDMYGRMDGLSAWMMRGDWSVGYGAAILAMWVAMMTGMMLPSATPLLLLYGRVARSAGPGAAGRVYALAGGYLLAWGGFSLLATLAQWRLATAEVLTPMMVLGDPRVQGLLLCVIGAYQLSSWKQRCLAHCRAPADFLVRHWRPHRRGALQMGLRHGLWCLGCCWGLMLLLFVGGVMSLAWIAGLTLWVLAEKLLPQGPLLARLAGLAAIAAGLIRLA